MLLGSLALCRPGVDTGDFVLESCVDKAVTLEGVETLELGGHDEGCESLTAATCKEKRKTVSFFLTAEDVIDGRGGLVASRGSCFSYRTCL